MGNKGNPGRPQSLTDADVIHARELEKTGHSKLRIARMFKVNRNTLTAAMKAYEARGKMAKDPVLAEKIEKATAPLDGYPNGIVNDITRLEQMDPAIKYLVARDLAECFLNDAQISLKRNVSLHDIRTIRRAIRRGEPFDCPPGFVEPAPSLQAPVPADRRGNLLRETLLDTAQRAIDAVSDEKLEDLPADKLIKGVKDLVSSAESIKDASSAKDAYGAVVSRARNVLIFNGEVDLNKVNGDLIQQYGLVVNPADERIIDIDLEDGHDVAPPPVPISVPLPPVGIDEPEPESAAADPFAI